MTRARCIRCGCTAPTAAHAVAAMLAADDLDGAIDAGWLDLPACSGCDAACRAAYDDARGQRLAALAARERFRAREQRLSRRAAAREAARATRTPAASTAGTNAPALPPAAAAALQRALARAGTRT